MGIVFTGLFALGLILVSVVPSQIDLFHILFGSVLGVSDADLLTARRHRRSRDRHPAAASTRPRALRLRSDPCACARPLARRLELLLLGALALTVVVALQAVGVLLVVAMLITPGATA